MCEQLENLESISADEEKWGVKTDAEYSKKNYPFKVVTCADDVKLYVSEMSLRTGRLERHHNSDDVEIAADKLEELYQSLKEPVAHVEKSTAQEKKVEYGATAETLRISSLIGSVLLMGLMIVVLLVSQYVLHRQRKELVYRSKLFDCLSLSIDDAFIIRDVDTGAISYRGLKLE
ncbi:hypothetical protein [[Clostridium] hylemonae]|uniref:hypothetical protein n=1 Tax=[Clostridium] hylemonae TaxID=89153 RepID=UPI001485C3E0|nr:hypothetical protein [[Clostridium] hylemonae]